MPASDLTLKYDDLYGHVGDFLGVGWGPEFGDPEWDVPTKKKLQATVDSGTRQFYNPVPLPGEQHAHTWSFLTPVGSFVLPCTQQYLDLPEDFGGLEAHITVAAEGQAFEPLPVVNIGIVKQHYSDYPNQTGRPVVAAIEWLEGGGNKTRSQKARLAVWPEADNDYTLLIHYFVNARALSWTLPHHMGGMPHSETILASCIAAAELFRDNEKGPRWEYYMERLRASVSHDRHMRPKVLGYNADSSDRMANHKWRWGLPQITINGTAY